MVQYLPNLNVSFNAICILPCDIDQFHYLKSIRLDSCKIRELPDEFYNLAKLMHLQLQFNKIKSISSKIKNLVNLKYIYLHSNCITEIPIELCDLNLKHLSLSCNNISVMPKKVVSQFNCVLWINDNPIEYEFDNIILNKVASIFRGTGMRLY